MNIQAMMKQAQQLQNKMLTEKKAIDEHKYEGKSSNVTITMTGDKKVCDVKFDLDEITNDDIEMLQDMVMLAFNDASSQIDKDTNEKLGKYSQGMPGLF